MKNNFSFLILILFSVSGFGQSNPYRKEFKSYSDSVFYVFTPEHGIVSNNIIEVFDIGYLLEKLNSGDDEIQIKSLFVLSYKREEQTISEIAKKLTSKNNKVVIHAIHALEKINNPKSAILLGDALNQQEYSNMHTYGYLIHALKNLTLNEGIESLNLFVNSLENEDDKRRLFQNLAIETIEFIKRYNDGVNTKNEMIHELLKSSYTRYWAFDKINSFENKKDWLPLLRSMELDINILIFREKIGDTEFSAEEKSLLNEFNITSENRE